MMKVTFDGVDFTKASEAAKQFGYTSDYIGQLCRSKKINARLVGRTWFVNIPSIEAHQDKRYQGTKKQTAPKKQTTISVQASSDPVTQSKTYLKRVQAPKSRTRFNVTSTAKEGEAVAVPLNYEPDEFSLIPQVESKPKITLLKVGIAGSEKLKIKSQDKKQNRLLPQPLPDVALSGKLPVQEIVAEESVEKESFKRDKPKNKTNNNDNRNKVSIIKLDTTDAIKNPSSPGDAEVKTKPAEKIVTPKKVKVSGISKKKSKDSAVSAPSNTREIPVENIGSGFLIPITSSLVATMIALTILTLEQVGYGTANTIEFSLDISWSNLASLGALLYTGT